MPDRLLVLTRTWTINLNFWCFLCDFRVDNVHWNTTNNNAIIIRKYVKTGYGLAKLKMGMNSWGFSQLTFVFTLFWLFFDLFRSLDEIKLKKKHPTFKIWEKCCGSVNFQWIFRQFSTGSGTFLQYFCCILILSWLSDKPRTTGKFTQDLHRISKKLLLILVIARFCVDSEKVPWESKIFHGIGVDVVVWSKGFLLGFWISCKGRNKL